LTTDGFILKVGVFEEEFFDKFGIEIFLFKLGFGESALNGLVTGQVFELEEGHEFLVVFVHDSVFGEILECRVQVHTGVPSEIHESFVKGK
jgi:hypothetical protein